MEFRFFKSHIWIKAASVAVLLAIVVAIGYWQWSDWRRSRPSPTLILILVDTLRADTLGCYGNPLPTSPNIDSLAREGAIFKQAFSVSGWTLPSVASIFTGTWPVLHGTYGKDRSYSPMRRDVPVASELFNQAGFNTFGITNAMFLTERLGFDRGFDVFDYDPAVVGRERRADKCVDRAIELLQENQGEPNFVLLHLFDPHLPYDPPKEFRGVFAPTNADKPFPLYMEKCLSWPGQKVSAKWPTKRGQQDDPPPADHVDYLKQVYYEEVNFLDAQVGRLIAALQEMGSYDNTTILLSSDHGEEFWEHGGFEHGHTLFDELIRVPLIIKPSKSHGVVAHEIATQVSSLDIMPTLFRYSGITPPSSFIGAPLQAMMSGEKEADRILYPERTLYGNDQYAVRDGIHKLILDVNPNDGGYVFELYNTKDDPLEQREISTLQPEKLEELKGLLFEHFGHVIENTGQEKREKPLELDPVEVERLKGLGYIR